MKTYKSLDEAIKHVKSIEKDIEKNLGRLQKRAQKTIKAQQKQLQNLQFPDLSQIKSKAPTRIERSVVLPAVATLGGLVLAGIGIFAAVKLREKKVKKQIADLRTAPSVSQERFAGRWFEIAHLPYHAEKNHVGSRKTFTLEEKDRYKVEYEAAVGSLDGKSVKKEGVARILDDNNTHMRLKLFGPLEVDYVILEKGDDYDHVVLGSPNKKHLWIMSRTPTMEPKQYEGIVKRMKKQGYDVDSLIEVTQDDHAEVPLHIHLKKKLEEKKRVLDNPQHQQQVEKKQDMGE